MKTKMLVLGAFIAGILSAFFGGKAFATAGNTAEISSGTWEICVNATLDTQSPDFSLDITKSGFESQLVLGGGECKTVKLTGSSAYTVSLGSTMGASSVNYEVSEGSLTFNVANSLNNYLNAFGSVTYTTEGSGEESDFELLFSMPGTCYLNGNANVSGDTCKDGDGNPLTDKKYVDTGVALFSEGNAARDFEIYFTLDDYASTQPNNQGTLFNVKYENSSMYYPGFTLRMSGSNVQTMELTGRIGNDNTDADKAKKDISTASLKGKEMKIVRVGGLVSYSIDGGELVEFQNYQNFSRYFEQSAVFGASLQTNGTPQRYYDGTVSNIRIYLKKVGNIEFNANGGTGMMATIENKMIGTDVVLPANTFTKNRAAFTGWNTEADGSGEDYADEATVTITSEDTLTLYAQWEDIQVGSIEFNANGGTGTMTTIEDIPVGTSATLPANTFTRTDYLFDGWNTESDGSGTGYADEATVTITSEDTLTLYAQWLVEPKGSIEFNANGGTGTMATIENITLGTNVTLPANTLTRTDYIFDGWNTESDGSGTGYADEATVTISTGGVLMLYAQWREPSGSIEFNANRGSGTMASINNIALGTSIVLPANTFTRTNADFIGWNTAADGSGTDYADEATITISEDGKMILYAQWTPVATTLKSGGTINTNLKSLAKGSTAGVNDKDELIEHIESVDTLPSVVDENTPKINIAKSGEIPVYAYWVADNKTIYIYSEANKIYTDVRADIMFDGLYSLSTLTFPTGFDTSQATEMDSMFSNTRSLTSLVLPVGFDTSRVKDMSYMFYGMDSLTALSFPSGFNTANVENMSAMFYSMDSLTSLTLPSGFDTSKVTNMSYMFWDNKALASLTLPASFDTSNVTNMANMFYNMQSITSLTLPASFDTSKVTNMTNMFYNMQSLTSLTLPSSFNTSQVTNMDHMLYGMKALTSLTLPSSFNTSKVTNMANMFAGMQSLTSLTLPSSFDTSKVTNMNAMFFNMQSLTSLTLPSSFDTSQATNMGSMFYNMSSLTSLTFSSNFNTSNVTAMGSMFAGMKNLTTLVLPAGFDTSKVTSMRSMFSGMQSLTSLTFSSGFSTSQVTDMVSMFSSMSSLTSLTLPSSFDTSKVTDMANMFYNMQSLTSLTFSPNFDTSQVTNMSYMFGSMSALTSLVLPATFDTSNVTNMNYMFYRDESLTSLILPDSFVITNGTTTTYIFLNVKSTATLYAADATVRSLWPGVLGN